MAKIWTHLSYHEDEIPKRPLTKDDIDFLLEIQKEMNTQDTHGQANPRYWTIKDYERFHGRDLNDPSGFVIYAEDGEIVDIDLDKYIDSRQAVTDAVNPLKSCLGIGDDQPEDPINDVIDLDDLQEFCSDHGFTLVYYGYTPQYKGMFLTHKDAEEHLLSNAHHYHQDAHTFALSAWRNPRIEKLYQILQETKWEDLLEII